METKTGTCQCTIWNRHFKGMDLLICFFLYDINGTFIKEKLQQSAVLHYSHDLGVAKGSLLNGNKL
jgi:hypothetical protein